VKVNENLFDPSNIEKALLALSSEAWQSFIEPSIIRRDDETYVTGDPFFDKMEDALASGENIHDLLSRFKS
jgi:hypothetical protein